MRVALLDPFAGVAGDMFVGALLDAGAPFADVRNGLAQLGIEDYKVSHRKVMRCGIAARKYRVTHKETHPHRGLKTILRRIRKSGLPKPVRDSASAAFTALGEAEAKIHGVALDKVHFHEVGAVDAICDIVGAAIALHSLGIERLYTRPLPLFYGMVNAAHGRIPLPAPATLELMRGWPTFDSGLQGELVTPTGAALVTAWSTREALPAMTPSVIGYGAGDRDPDGYPNVCRITVGDTATIDAALRQLECDVDDATPQVLGHLVGRLIEAGALDATLSPLTMKKGRPGTRVTALARSETVPVLEDLLFREGTTLGVRRSVVERTELPRRRVKVKTQWGMVHLKIGELHGEAVHVAPEYEDCKRAAEEHGVPLRKVARAAMQQWQS